MSFLRVLLSILFPPFAVIDQGYGSVLIVFILSDPFIVNLREIQYLDVFHPALMWWVDTEAD